METGVTGGDDWLRVEPLGGGLAAPLMVEQARGDPIGVKASKRAGGVTGAAPEVDCRALLLAAVEELDGEPRSIRAQLDACRDDPARFQQEVLGRRLWSKQVEVCHAIARSPVTVVPAGRSVGKSYLLAGTVLWCLYTRPRSLVITTGPDHRQVVSVLWKEIRRALRPRFQNGRRISPILNLGFDHLTEGYNSPQRLTVQAGTDWGALGFAAQYEEGFSGQYAGDLLVIVDEASGVTPPIWSAIHGLAAARLVICGNPIRYDCHFRELHDIAAKGSATITSVGISSLESPVSMDPNRYEVSEPELLRGLRRFRWGSWSWRSRRGDRRGASGSQRVCSRGSSAVEETEGREGRSS